MSQQANETYDAVTQLFTPQNFIPEGFYGYPMPEASQDVPANPQDIIFTFEKMINEAAP